MNWSIGLLDLFEVQKDGCGMRIDRTVDGKKGLLIAFSTSRASSRITLLLLLLRESKSDLSGLSHENVGDALAESMNTIDGSVLGDILSSCYSGHLTCGNDEFW